MDYDNGATPKLIKCCLRIRSVVVNKHHSNSNKPQPAMKITFVHLEVIKIYVKKYRRQNKLVAEINELGKLI